MTDTKSSNKTPETSENSENVLPLLPVRFSNPQDPTSKRQIEDLSVDNLFINQIDNNEALLQSVNQVLNRVDIVLENTDHSLQINLLDLTINMADNENLLIPNHQKVCTSKSSNESQKINHTHQNLSHQPLSNFGKLVGTIGLEAALKLLPHIFSGPNHENIELFLEQCEFAYYAQTTRQNNFYYKVLLYGILEKPNSRIPSKLLWNHNRPQLIYIWKCIQANKNLEMT